MTHKEQLQLQYEDALFALLMDEVASAEGEKYIQENENLQNDPTAEIPASVQERCLRTIKRAYSAQQLTTVGRGAIKLVNKIAVVALAAIAFFTIAFAASPNFRLRTLNFLVEVTENGSFFHLAPDNSAALAPEYINITWIPVGFECAEHTNDEFDEVYVISNGAQEINIRFCKNTNAGIALDTEDAEISQIDIGAYEATLIQKYDEVRLIWADEEAAFIVLIESYGAVSAEDVITIAQNIEYC